MALLVQRIALAPGFGGKPVRHACTGARSGLRLGWVGPFFECLDAASVRLAAGGGIHERAGLALTPALDAGYGGFASVTFSRCRDIT